MDSAGIDGAAAVTVHRYGVGRGDRDALLAALGARFESLQAELPGLRGAVLLVGFGGEDIAVVAGWESRDAQVAGTAAIRSDPELHATMQDAGIAEHAEYRVVPWP